MLTIGTTDHIVYEPCEWRSPMMAARWQIRAIQRWHDDDDMRAAAAVDHG